MYAAHVSAVPSNRCISQGFVHAHFEVSKRARCRCISVHCGLGRTEWGGVVIQANAFRFDGRSVFYAATVVVVMGMASCGSSPQATTEPVMAPSVPVAPSQFPSAGVTPDELARQHAAQAYQDMFADFVAAGRTSDWRSPALGKHATGRALTNLTRGLYADHFNGFVTMGEPRLNPRVVAANPQGDPTSVLVHDCGDSTKFAKRRADSGQPANDSPGGRQFIQATVQKRRDGSWKVSDFGIRGVGSC
jgi:hypothetical protein